MNGWLQAGAWAAALALTLVLAAVLTPRAWWRRPTLGALALVAGGTLGVGALFGLLGRPATAFQPTASSIAPSIAQPIAPTSAAPHSAPAAGGRYRAVDVLNLRAGTGVGAPRLAVLAPGTVVTATGQAERDWWRVRARVDGGEREGWASSLWLRRADEGRIPR